MAHLADPPDSRWRLGTHNDLHSREGPLTVPAANTGSACPSAPSTVTAPALGVGTVQDMDQHHDDDTGWVTLTI